VRKDPAVVLDVRPIGPEPPLPRGRYHNRSPVGHSTPEWLHANRKDPDAGDGIEITVDFLKTGHTVREPRGEVTALWFDDHNIVLGHIGFDAHLQGHRLTPSLICLEASYLLSCHGTAPESTLLLPALTTGVDEARLLKALPYFRSLTKLEEDQKGPLVKLAINECKARSGNAYCVDQARVPQIHANASTFLALGQVHYNFGGVQSRAMPVQTIIGPQLRWWLSLGHP